MPEEYVPPVVAVVVTTEAATRLDECLESLEQQDYPSLAVLVIDTGATGGLANRVARVLPGAVVRRRPNVAGFADAANEVLVGIEGASFFLFCHDDVALRPSALRLMVEEAFRSNGGIVGPKLLDWDSSDRLLQVGLGVSRFGSPVSRIQEGELDQSQHDEVREVFAVPSACLLVRVDLFAAIGGFDPEMGAYGEDVDLCWRAQLAGARVVTAPRAIVRHRAATAAGERQIEEELAVRRANELRAVLKNYRFVRRLVIAVQLFGLMLIDSATAPLTDRRSRARAARSAWRWNFARRRSLSEARRVVHELRQVSDRALAARMARRHHFHRISPPPPGLREGAAARGHRGAHRGAAEREAMLARQARPGDRHLGDRHLGDRHPGDRHPGDRHPEVDKVTEWLARARQGDVPLGQVAAALAIGVLGLFGIRGLLFGQLPVVGDLVAGPSALHLLAQWLGGRSDPGWRPGQVGPAAYGVIGLAGTILGNSSAVALKLAYVSGLAVGTIGTSRLVRDFGSSRARIVAAVVFAASPLVWNGLAAGDVEVSVALAGMPFVLGRLARASGLRPFVPAHSPPSRGWNARDLIAEIAPLGLLLAVMGALAPPAVLDVGVVVVAALVACIAVGGARAMLRSALVGAGGVAVAFGCCLPWSITWLQGGARWSLFAGSAPAAGNALSPADLLRGHIGPIGGWWGTAGFVVLAGFGFLWARGPRLAWVARWWVCALGSVLLAWVASEGWLGTGGGRVGALLAPATVAFAACAGIAVAAFELDLKRHRFGWRQITGVLAAACLAVSLVPALGALLGGSAGLPGIGFEETSAEFTTSFPPGARVLWIGNPKALPGSAFQAAPGLAAFVSTSGLPSMATLWPPANPGPAGPVTADIVSAVAGRTLQLGALLAPAGVRFIVVPTAAAPALVGEQTPPLTLPPAGLVRALKAQIDLSQLPNDDGVLVWANVGWDTADGAGTLSRSSSSSLGVLPLLGVAAGLAAILACLGEGVARRRRAGRAGRAGRSGRSGRTNGNRAAGAGAPEPAYPPAAPSDAGPPAAPSDAGPPAPPSDAGPPAPPPEEGPSAGFAAISEGAQE